MVSIPRELLCVAAGVILLGLVFSLAAPPFEPTPPPNSAPAEAPQASVPQREGRQSSGATAPAEPEDSATAFVAVAPAAPSAEAPPLPKEEPAFRFETTGLSGDVVAAVEKVVGKGHARAAQRPGEGEARWICLLVDDAGPFYWLDEPWRLDDFPGLKDAGFEVPPLPLQRKLSLYLAHAKRAIGYRRDRGDRIAVLTCPRERWESLKLDWPAEAKTSDDGF